MKKKVIAMSFVAALVLATTACGTGNVDKEEATTTQSIEIVEDSEATDDITEENITDVENETTEAVVDEEALYKDTIDHYYEILTSEYDPDATIEDGENGIFEVVSFSDGTDPALHVGYTLIDLSGDGIKELVIGDVLDDAAAMDSIYALYTLVDGKPVLVTSGWSRNWVTLLDDGKLYNYGSSGAAYNGFGVFTLSEDGTAMVWEDYYFTAPADDEMSIIKYYHNTTGDMEPSNAEELSVSDAEFWAKEEEFRNRSVETPITPFSEYKE